MKIYENYRNELKYLVSEKQIEILKSRINSFLPLDRNAKAGKYIIRSLYFDTIDNEFFYDNESGTDPREKYRIRIYNNDDSRIAFECKSKYKGLTHKEQSIVDKQVFKNYINHYLNIGTGMKTLDKFLLMQKTKLLRPVIIVEYDRIPYVYNDGNVRITFDMNIRSSSNLSDFLCSEVPYRLIQEQNWHVLEVKFDSFLPSFIYELLDVASLQQTTFSKYYYCRKYSI